MKNLLFIIFISLPIVATSAILEVDSTVPEVNVYISSDLSSEPVEIGVTPLERDLDSLIDTYVKDKTFYIMLKKKGYEDYNVLFTKISSTDISLNVNLKVVDEIKKVKEYDIMMSELFNVQKLIRGGNYSDAIKTLDILENKYNGFSIISELKATTYYLSKDVEKALAYYRKAFSQNEKNQDAYKMKVYLEKKLGVYTEL